MWAVDLTEMKPISSKNKNVKYLLCVIDVLTKYAQVKPLNDKKVKTVLDTFIEIVNESNGKPINYWLIKENNFIIKLYKNGQTIIF